MNIVFHNQVNTAQGGFLSRSRACLILHGICYAVKCSTSRRIKRIFVPAGGALSYYNLGGETMAEGKENLIPMNERTEEEQREIARKGGIESGKARRRKRTMKEAAQIILNAPASPEQAELLKKYGIAEQDCTNLMVLIAKFVLMATEGNVKAGEFVRDVMGENPKYKIYEKRLEYLIKDKEAPGKLVAEWIEAVMSTESE